MIDIISLQEVAAILGYKDIRSAERWCKQNEVRIFSDNKSKRRYVLADKLHHALMENLKAQGGYSIRDCIDYDEKFLEKRMLKKESTTYQAVGECEKEFAAGLQALIKQK